MFELSLLGTSVQATLDANLKIRPLQTTDYDKGYLGLLTELTVVGDMTRERFLENFNYLKNSGIYFAIAIEEISSGKVVAAGTLMIETKFIHNCGKVGHIEDIVVSQTQRGKNLGKKLVEQLLVIGKAQGCYKVLLNCKEHNRGFYEKCGMVQKEIAMVKYFQES